MISSIGIRGLRGVGSGSLKDLSRLVVLVGPNSSGKSTILDAMLIGAGEDPARSTRHVLRRRPLTHGARWLIHGAQSAGVATIEVDGARGHDLTLRWHQGRHRLEELTRGRKDVVEVVEISTNTPNSWRFGPLPEERALGAFVAVTREGELLTGAGLELVDSDAWLIDPRHGLPLHDLYSRVTEAGRRQRVLGLVSAVVPGLQSLDVLTDRGDPRLHLTFKDRSVPVAMAGDGIQVLVRLCLEFASRPEGTLLLEEPEAHQHPAAIRQSARAIVDGVRGGVQAVIATHSLELLDALVAELSDEELGLLSLYRVGLERGELRSLRLEGQEVRAARHDIEEDLR